MMQKTTTKKLRMLAGAFTMAAAASAMSGAAQAQTCNTPAYYYLTCGATGYQVNAANRITQVDQGTYSLRWPFDSVE